MRDEPKKNDYFNAGVMLINLDYWRKNDIGRKIKEFKLQNSDKILGNDGGAINGVLSGFWGRLPPKWNQQSGLYKRKFRKGNKVNYRLDEINEALRYPAIIHYVGERKPWLPGCPHPLSQRYWVYRHDLGLGGNEIKISDQVRKILKKPHHFIRKWWYRAVYS
jgi:lipopolysaccharide biosynthesis glycosyltransferase